MAKFKFSFERTYSITEGFTRVIDAPSFAEAQAAAHNLCTEFNHDCPDDCSEIESGDTETGSFYPESPPAIRDTTEAPDYVVDAMGQVLPHGE